ASPAGRRNLAFSKRDSRWSLPRTLVRGGNDIKRDGNDKKTHWSGMTSHLKLRILRLEHNKGPAVARNRGAKAARGKFLLFLDSDVQVFPDTLKNLAKIYQNDPDIVAVTGVWVKEQKTRDFFPNFKALRDWSYWINERDVGG